MISELQARIARLENSNDRLEKLALNTGESFAGICDVMDGVQTAKTGNNEEYHCCVNKEENKMHCAPTTLASALGIDTSNGENSCDSRNTAQFCSQD